MPSLVAGRPHRETVWRPVAGAGALLVASDVLVPPGLARDGLYLLLGLGCVGAIVLGVRVHRPQGRSPWWWFAAGQLLWCAGDTTYAWLADVLGVAPSPSVADAFYLAAYPFIAVGVVRLVVVRRPRAGLRSCLDAGIVTVSLGLLSWVLLAGPTATSDASLFERLVGVAYPAGDILVLAGIVLLVTTMSTPLPAYRMLVAAVLALVVGDVAFAMTSYGLFSDPHALLDLTWLSAYVMWGVAALHPSMAQLSRPSTAPAPAMTTRRLVLLGGSALVPSAVLAVMSAAGSTGVAVWPVVVSATTTSALVVLRLGLAIRDAARAIRVGEELTTHLAHQAAHDDLTLLSNRAHALELLDLALRRAAGAGTGVAVVFLDLDHFKTVNDTYGHAAGDHVLRVAAERMRASVRPDDVVGRLGGDEFVVVVEGLDAGALGLAAATRLQAALGDPIALPGHDHVVTLGVSAGMSLSSGEPVGPGSVLDPVPDAARLLSEADIAAYRAKAAGRGRVEVFDEALRRQLAQTHALGAALEQALAADELVLHYQPVLHARCGGVAGYEALVRWQRPGHGLVGPQAFVEFAEQSDLIVRIGAWVLREACRQLSAWTRVDPDRFAGTSVAVNISGRHLRHDTLLEDVRLALEASGLDPHRLVVEVTETVLVDVHEVATTLTALRTLGVRVSIDDFGTGYTSFGQLATLPADELKIDRSLVSGASPGRADLLRLVVHAAHAFGLVVVAEGIEDEDQLALVTEVGADLVQGYLLGRPAPAERPGAAAPGGARGSLARTMPCPAGRGTA